MISLIALGHAAAGAVKAFCSRRAAARDENSFAMARRLAQSSTTMRRNRPNAVPRSVRHAGL
jgi:hypothetical protein